MSLLQVRGLARSYYGVHALRGVDLTVRAGQKGTVAAHRLTILSGDV
jgi:ABC-type sugar transport system ATPase subunit